MSAIRLTTRYAGSTLVLSLLVAIGSLALVACSSSSSGSSSTDGGVSTNSNTPDGGGSASGTVGDLCSAGAPCASGLTCADSGTLLGRCTADCSANLDLCATQFGSQTLCLNASQCALICTDVSECPGAAAAECTSLSSGMSACVTNQNGLPDASRPADGACVNLGGAYGDTVVNGGYRCTPSANGDLATGIDQCKNGSWVSAFTCTCQVTSSVSAVQDPSQCFDIDAPDTARCEYATDYCEQCDPTGGCQSH